MIKNETMERIRLLSGSTSGAATSVVDQDDADIMEIIDECIGDDDDPHSDSISSKRKRNENA
jgi:hypothetical protein